MKLKELLKHCQDASHIQITEYGVSLITAKPSVISKELPETTLNQRVGLIYLNNHGLNISILPNEGVKI